uniref:ubiquitinyl hydrolase 1 n=1 Tax=Ciona savignyi TaxID=51511 RepID=H2ZLN3_CIOSA
NFYQTLAGVTHLDESDITELEKQYWLLKSQSKTGRFDLTTFTSFVSPPLPPCLVQGLFNAFDENRDGHIDFKEISCGVSACCRGPLAERQKFCYKMFDSDQDGKLNSNEIKAMAVSLLQKGEITLEEYQLWSLDDPLPISLLNIVVEICHIVLGLRPTSPIEEGIIIRGWMQRASQSELTPGETWYIASGKWWQQWKLHTQYDRLSKSTPTNVDPSPGPINNLDILAEESKLSTLTDEGGRLREGLVEGSDFVVLPAQVWKALHHWYGGSPVLPRIVPAPNKGEKCWIELHRLNILILRHQIASSMQQLSHIAFPGNTPISSVGNTAFGMLKQSLNYVTVVCIVKFDLMRLFLSTPTISNLISRFLYATSKNYKGVNLIEITKNNLIYLNIAVRNVDMSWPEELSQIARNQKQKTKTSAAVVAGATGLSNLGNTCFMNSGLQCISNTRPLTKYFLENKHLYELNRTNPLGMKGHIAKRYCDLTQELWSGSSKTVAPLKLRWTISKYAPRFNGFSQHDSQELLAFLLDGLHEDLNRVQTKPYVELKDSDGRPDEEVAQEAWENHLARNQSIIVDLFHGQIRSRVRCLQCSTLSIRFDPFTFLSLPLPMDNSMYLDVIVIRLNEEIPVRYGLRLNMDDTFAEVRKHLADKCKISMDAVLLTEVLGATIKTFLQDNLKVRSVSVGNIYAFEIPAPCDAGDMQTQCAGYVVAYHRKIFHIDVYFLSSQKHRPSLFGLPLVVPCVPGRPKKELYSAVWRLVSRLCQPRCRTAGSPQGREPTRKDCDDSMGSKYPFTLRCIDAYGMSCGNKCPWFRFCTGCVIECTDEPWHQTSGHIAIDWDPTALHLRYQPSAEREVTDDSSVEEGHRGVQQHIDLKQCLRAFTTEEELGKDELYHCGKCKTMQLAKKKLDIWRLPPTLIIHLKRFQFVNGRWIKSHKVVDFPKTDFDPSSFMTKRDEENLDVEAQEITTSCHSGILGGGHYIAYAKNKVNNKWYCYNDSSCKEVRNVSADNINVDTAYTLFYERQGI